MIIAGDLNESINFNQIVEFLTENGLFDAYGQFNGTNEIERESTYEYRKSCIDIFITIAGLLEFVNRCKFVKFHEMIIIDYYSYIIDLNLQDYFKVRRFDINRIESLKLDSRRASHKQKFNEKVEELKILFNLRETMDKHCYIEASNDQLNIIDQQISLILDITRKEVEGPIRGITFLITKLVEYSTLLCCIAKVKLF